MSRLIWRAGSSLHKNLDSYYTYSLTNPWEEERLCAAQGTSVSICKEKGSIGIFLMYACSHLHFLKDFNTCDLLIGSTSDYWIVICLLLLLKLCSKSLSKTASRIFLTFLFLKCQ